MRIHGAKKHLRAGKQNRVGLAVAKKRGAELLYPAGPLPHIPFNFAATRDARVASARQSCVP